MTSPFSLQGKTALVTGAAGGIGQAVAATLGALGARLVLVDLREDAVNGVASQLEAQRIACLPLAGDLSDREQTDALLAQAARWAPIDILVCNAGIHGPQQDPEHLDWADYRRTFAVNLDGPFHLCRRLIPAMAQRGGGSVVLMASLSALRGNGAIGIYGMTKAALVQAARDLAVQWGRHNVRVNAVSPGVIETPFATAITEDTARRVSRIAQTPLRRFGTPEEVAGAVAFLASAAGGFVTGHNLVVDGGTLIGDGS
ncbi:MAG TPA: SDR family NAD(P)-dependent oxidoreductase [Rhodocyclaceae bacterium]|nr:SDR family NAD(P)-dependent oxidoreductase [Rhodocyclaceae bacterium]